MASTVVESRPPLRRTTAGGEVFISLNLKEKVAALSEELCR
jgi:hypothetical protein